MKKKSKMFMYFNFDTWKEGECHNLNPILE